jgi:hypothetical protein
VTARLLVAELENGGDDGGGGPRHKRARLESFNTDKCIAAVEFTVLQIRLRRIHMFLGVPNPHPDPLVRDMDPQHCEFINTTACGGT